MMKTVTAHTHDASGLKSPQDPHLQDHTGGFRLLPVSPQTYSQLSGKQSQGLGDGDGVTMLEIKSSHKLFSVISRYVSIHGNKTSDHSHSWLLADGTVKRSNRSSYSDDEGDDDDDSLPDTRGDATKEVSELRLGLGLHEVTFQGRLIRLVHQAIGQPVGGPCGVSLYTSMVLSVPGEGKQALLSAFCDHVLDWDCEKDDKRYNIYMWKPQHMYWNKVATKRVRPIDSVILPADVKDAVVSDLTDFDTRETARWYTHHGIPYKRSMLFYGPPGTGKSSFITALAGELQRNVCFLQPAHPSITDDNLQLCVQSAPANSLIVMEDVDALFSRDRDSKAAGTANAPLTFSGLLNALDGVCNPEGQVFILTTNHVERLDPALIRPGRVDLKVRFTTATKGQAAALFQHFYPDESELAHEFAEVIASRSFNAKDKKAEAETTEADGEETAKVVEEDGGLGVSMAALQQLFIICRKSSPAEALDKARSFVF